MADVPEMSKDEFVKLLRSKGYEDVENERGCVMVTCEKRSTWRTVKKIAKEAGYDRSFGWRPKRREAE